MTPFLNAFLLAIGLSLGVGPGLVLQIDSSIQRGFRGGALVVLGIFIADLIFLIIAGFGFSSVVQGRHGQMIMGMTGGLVLCVMGIRMWFKKPNLEPLKTTHGQMRRIRHYLEFFLKGIFVNLTNPTVIFFWMTLTGLAIGTYGYRTEDYYFFFISFFSVSLTMDLIKVRAISHYHKFLGPGFLRLAGRLLGTVLAGIGIYFFIRAVTLL